MTARVTPPRAPRRARPVPEVMDEMCAPGGLTWDELVAFPNLADFEAELEDGGDDA
jgi:hypothetical protein